MSDDRLARIVAALETAATAYEGAENETPGHIPYRFTFPAIARELLLMTTEISPTERQAAVKSIHAVRKAAGTLLSLMGGVHLTVVDDVGLGLADVRAAERKARALLIAFLSGLATATSDNRSNP